MRFVDYPQPRNESSPHLIDHLARSINRTVVRNHDLALPCPASDADNSPSVFAISRAGIITLIMALLDSLKILG
jgi:hypothetical protein